MRTWMISLKNFVSLLALSSLLATLRAFNPVSLRAFVLMQSKLGFIVVFWPVNKASQSHPPDTVLMSMVRLLTWLSRLWTHSRTWATRGSLGEEDGDNLMLYTSNFPEPQRAQKSEANPPSPSTRKDSANSPGGSH